MHYYSRLTSPLGDMVATADDHALTGLYFCDQRDLPDLTLFQFFPQQTVLQQTQQQLSEYFQKSRQSFDLPLNAQGTLFQHQVWQLLRAIPYGKTISYLQLALQVGNPKATRAVANANARNPLVIIVPCHRVIGSDGKLTGFASGLHRKQALLVLEQDLPLFKNVYN